MTNAQQLAETFVRGHRLAESSMGITAKDSLINAKGWKEMVAGIKDDRKRAFTALMLENYRVRRAGLDEATSTLQVGNFDKWAFPIISIVSENLVAQDLVSVQPLEGPNGTVFYMNFVTGQAKGAVPHGAKIWDSRTGHADRYLDSSDRVENESLASSGGVITTGNGINLSYGPIMPGTVMVVNGAITIRDDGNGNLLNSSAAVVGSINYATGAIAFNVSAADTTSGAAASYNYNSELNPDAQQVDFEIQSSPIYAKERKLRGRWSTEAAQALEALHEIKAEDVVSTAITNHLQWEIDREIIEDLRRQAGAGLVRWSAQIPAASYISYTEHKLSFIDALVTGSNFIYRATNRVKANWVLAGMQASNVLETLPQFEPANASESEFEGVTQLGTIGRTKVYSDPHYRVDEALMGFKGNDFVRTGYIFAPWILLYSTMLITLDDFVARKGFASQYGKKLVNSKFYTKLKLSGFQAQFGAF
jgi:hypothetical protein